MKVLNIVAVNVSNFKYASNKNEIEKKIFEFRNNKLDLFENKNDYILYNINKVDKKEPDLDNAEIKEEITELISQKNKFIYNKNLMERINNNSFDDKEFLEMGDSKINTLTLDSIKDNSKFELNAVELLYSLPINSFTLINDEKNNIYLIKIKNFQNIKVNTSDLNYKKYISKQSSNSKNDILKTYDLLLNKKYNVVLNQKTIERVKNFYQ